MRSSTRFGLMLCILALALAGCIASTGSEAELRASEGSGGILVHLLLEDGELVSAESWWEDQAPDVDVSLQERAEDYKGLVLKNDIVVSEEPLLGSSTQAMLAWSSVTSGTVAEPGDRFEVLLVDVAEDRVVATYSLTISA